MVQNQFTRPMQKRRRRSQRLILRVLVIAYRSQNLGSAFSEATHTLVVNAHGALINLEAKVAVHEKVLLKHALSGEERECRVVFTRGSTAVGPIEVGVEFRRPVPNFWQIAFPPSDWSVHASAS